MRFTVDGTQHELDEEKITFAEGRALEKVTNLAFGELGPEAVKGRLGVIQGFVWIALKRTEPTLKYSDLDDRQIGDFTFDDEDADEDEADPGTGERPTPSEPGTPTDAPSDDSA